MAYVIAVCGAGGKTTICKRLATHYANENNKVCITTTTNMWFDSDVRDNFFDIDSKANASDILHKVYYSGHENIEKGKLTPLSNDEYKKLCSIFDYVIVEADGSKGMPMKIPYGIKDERYGDKKSGKNPEPVIPDNANEIIIVVGMEALGRKISYVCHRFDEFYDRDEFIKENDINEDTLVDEKIIDKFVNHYYLEPIKEKFPSTKVYIYKNDYVKNKKSSSNSNIFLNERLKDMDTKICIAICASGFSRRYGDENKLLERVIADCTPEMTEDEQTMVKKHLKLYQAMINKALVARRMVNDQFDELPFNDTKIDIAVVSQYDEILNDDYYKDKVTFIKNDRANEGLSSSIKLVVESYKDYYAIMFLNSDMPVLNPSEIAKFIFNSTLADKKMATMYTNMPKNPAYFKKECFDDLFKLQGDKGAKELLTNNLKDVYRYYINSKELFEIDTKEDFENYQRMVVEELFKD